MNKSRCSDEYKVGVGKFLKFAFQNSSRDGKILCPCKYYVNRFLYTYEETRMHLICDGFIKGYKKWIFHGENSFSNASTSLSLWKTLILIEWNLFRSKQTHEG